MTVSPGSTSESLLPDFERAGWGLSGDDAESVFVGDEFWPGDSESLELDAADPGWGVHAFLPGTTQAELDANAYRDWLFIQGLGDALSQRLATSKLTNRQASVVIDAVANLAQPDVLPELVSDANVLLNQLIAAEAHELRMHQAEELIEALSELVGRGAGPFSATAIAFVLKRLRSCVDLGRIDLAWIDEAEQIAIHREEPYVEPRVSVLKGHVLFSYGPNEERGILFDSRFPLNSEDTTDLQDLLMTEEGSMPPPAPAEITRAHQNYVSATFGGSAHDLAVLRADMELRGIPLPSD